LNTGIQGQYNSDLESIPVQHGGLDIEHEIAEAERDLGNTRLTSEQDNYDRYGFWLLCAGRVGAANRSPLRFLPAQNSRVVDRKL